MIGCSTAPDTSVDVFSYPELKNNIYLFEINDVLTGQIKLPYSTGVIWSYCLLNEEINNNYSLDGWFYYRQDIEEIMDKIENPSVLGFNCFVWNWKFNNQLAERIKENILIV